MKELDTTPINLNTTDIEISNYEYRGRTFTLKRTNPFGFWVISLPDGPVPEFLKNHQFTSRDEAIKRITEYMNKFKETENGITQEPNGDGPTRA